MGLRHRETWKTIIENLRLLGYKVSDRPTIVSPHLLPLAAGGRPQVRERVFIPAVYESEGSPVDELRWEPLADNRPIDGWDPQQWRIEDFLQRDSEIPEISRYTLRDNEIAWLDAWNELLQALPAERLPGFPIWADEFRETPEIPRDAPDWKADFLEKNSAFYRSNRGVIDNWLRRHDGLLGFPPSRRKFEWQAQDSPRDVWRLVLHLRPSGIRVKRGTYLPALVAITQTSIIGWRRRRITPREAARLQGFPDDFRLHPDDAIAYRHLGNAVSVGVVTHLLRMLVSRAAAIETVEESAAPGSLAAVS